MHTYLNLKLNFSEDGKTTFEKCLSYDVSGWGTINEDFNSALNNRPENYADATIACQSYTYNTSEGLDTIVNDVSCFFYFFILYFVALCYGNFMKFLLIQ